MPESLKGEYTDLKNVGGTVEIPNPLYAYRFPQDTARDLKIGQFTGESRLAGYPTTTRYLNESSELSPEGQKERLLATITPYSRGINKQLRVEINLRERVLYLLQAYETFSSVSHNQWDPAREPDRKSGGPKVKSLGLGFGSIEDIHNSLHVLIGGSGTYTGHMKHVPIAAFDPIFWLHHAYVNPLGPHKHLSHLL
jgi:tyrosinase